MQPFVGWEASDWINVIAIVSGTVIGLAGLIFGERSNRRQLAIAHESLAHAKQQFEFETTPRIEVQAPAIGGRPNSPRGKFIRVSAKNMGKVEIVLEYFLVTSYRDDGHSAFSLAPDVVSINNSPAALPLPVGPNDRVDAVFPVATTVAQMGLHRFEECNDVGFKLLDTLDREYNSARNPYRYFADNDGYFADLQARATPSEND